VKETKLVLKSGNRHGNVIQEIKTRKAMLTQRGTRNSGAPSYASDP